MHGQHGGGGTGGLGALLTRGAGKVAGVVGLGLSAMYIGGRVKQGIDDAQQHIIQLGDLGKTLKNVGQTYDQFYNKILKTGEAFGYTNDEIIQSAEMFKQRVGNSMGSKGFAGTLTGILGYARSVGMPEEVMTSGMGFMYNAGVMGGKDQQMNPYQFIRLLAQATAGGKMTGRSAELLDTMQQLISVTQQRLVQAPDMRQMASIMTQLNQSGVEGLRGYRGAQLLERLDQAIANPGGGEAGELAMYRALNAGSGQPMNYFEFQYLKEEGAWGRNQRTGKSNIQAIMEYLNTEPLYAENPFARAEAANQWLGLSRHQYMALEQTLMPGGRWSQANMGALEGAFGPGMNKVDISWMPTAARWASGDINNEQAVKLLREQGGAIGMNMEDFKKLNPEQQKDTLTKAFEGAPPAHTEGDDLRKSINDIVKAYEKAGKELINAVEDARKLELSIIQGLTQLADKTSAGDWATKALVPLIGLDMLGRVAGGPGKKIYSWLKGARVASAAAEAGAAASIPIYGPTGEVLTTVAASSEAAASAAAGAEATAAAAGGISMALMALPAAIAGAILVSEYNRKKTGEKELRYTEKAYDKYDDYSKKVHRDDPEVKGKNYYEYEFKRKDYTELRAAPEEAWYKKAWDFVKDPFGGPNVTGGQYSPGGGVVNPLGKFGVTSGFGPRGSGFHTGVDFSLPIGTSVAAIGSGTVQTAYSENSYGKYIKLHLDTGEEVIYGHLSSFNVVDGQRVQAGAQIGYSGNTGKSTGPHLHFEVRQGGQPINPMGWLGSYRSSNYLAGIKALRDRGGKIGMTISDFNSLSPEQQKMVLYGAWDDVSRFDNGVGRWRSLVEKEARAYGVDPNLVLAVMQQESGGNPRAISGEGARGLLQLMPATARSLGVKNIFDPEQNIRGGVMYLSDRIKEFGGDIRLGLAGYNAGPGDRSGYNPRTKDKGVWGAIRKAGGKLDWHSVKPFLPTETQNYVENITQKLGGLIGGGAPGSQYGEPGMSNMNVSFDPVTVRLLYPDGRLQTTKAQPVGSYQGVYYQSVFGRG